MSRRILGALLIGLLGFSVGCGPDETAERDEGSWVEEQGGEDEDGGEDDEGLRAGCDDAICAAVGYCEPYQGICVECLEDEHCGEGGICTSQYRCVDVGGGGGDGPGPGAGGEPGGGSGPGAGPGDGSGPGDGGGGFPGLPGDGGESCDVDTDCGSEEICVIGMCLPDLGGGGGGFPGGGGGFPGGGGGGFPGLPGDGGESCDVDTDCGSEEICVIGMCLPDIFGSGGGGGFPGGGDGGGFPGGGGGGFPGGGDGGESCEVDDDCDGDDVCMMGMCLPDFLGGF